MKGLQKWLTRLRFLIIAISALLARAKLTMAAAVELNNSNSRTTSGHVWYFGIGSMMSSVALGLREVRPVRSLWCEIQNYRKVFYAPSGMATLVPEKGAVAQAVAHEISQAELRKLEMREPPSVAMYARLRGIEGEHVVVTGVASVASHFIFLRGIRTQHEQIGRQVMQPSTGAMGRITAVHTDGINVAASGASTFTETGAVLINGQPLGSPAKVIRTQPVCCPPTARYLDLMVEGAKSVGMHAAELRQLAAMPCTPRKSLQELQRLPVDDDVANCFFSRADVDQSDSLRLVRGMVFECKTSVDTAFGRGADLGIFFAQQLRDPLYGDPPLDPRRPWDGWAFIEDIVCDFLPGLKHVGWLAAERAISKL